MGNIGGLFGKMAGFAKTNDRVILTTLSLAGLLATAWAAYKSGPKVEKAVKKAKRDMEDVVPDDKEAKRAVIATAAKEIAPAVIPVVVMGGVTTACILGNHKASSRRIAVLSAAYTVSETALRELNGKMNEMLGENKVKSIKDAIVKDGLVKDGKENYPHENQIIMTGGGDVLCKDVQTGRYFKCNAEKVKQAINQLSHDILSEMWISLNDFYDLIGLPMVPLGDELGWNVEDCYKGQIPITLTAQLTENQEPCLCLDYDIRIRHDYRN